MENIREQSIHELGKYFEQSIISHRPTAEVIKVCENAVKYNLAGVYCSAYELPVVKSVLAGTDLFLGMGISFPRGIDLPESKAFIAEKEYDMGITNIDFVMNYRALMEGKVDIVEKEVALIRKAVPDAVLKMIIECCFLTDDQIDIACKIAIRNKVDFVKSSTGQNNGPSFPQICRIVDHMHGAGLRAKVAGVKFPHPQNAMVTLLGGIDRIGSQQCVETLDGIQLLKDRGIF